MVQRPLGEPCALDWMPTSPSSSAGFTDASIDGLLAAARESPAGIPLLLQHALREPEFRERIEKFRAGITAAAYLQIATCPNTRPTHTISGPCSSI